MREVQFGHLVALTEIEEKQKGHGWVLGVGSGSFSFFLRNLLICFTSKNIANAVMKKLIRRFKNSPYAIIGAPAAFAAAKDWYDSLERLIYKLENSTLPKIMPIGGMIMSFTKEFTMPLNPAPKT